MTDHSMAFQHHFGENFPLLSLDKRTRDALAAYAAFRWPSGRRKAVMKEWGLSEDEARSVCAGRASWGTFDKILHHKQGGWSVVFAIFGALLGETAEQFIISERKAHADRARRLGALVGDWWPLAADGTSDRDHLGDGEPERTRARRSRVG